MALLATCAITETRRFSLDLPQGGPEFLYKYVMFTGSKNIVCTTKECLMEEKIAIGESTV